MPALFWRLCSSAWRPQLHPLCCVNQLPAASAKLMWLLNSKAMRLTPFWGLDGTQSKKSSVAVEDTMWAQATQIGKEFLSNHCPLELVLQHLSQVTQTCLLQFYGQFLFQFGATFTSRLHSIFSSLLFFLVVKTCSTFCNKLFFGFYQVKGHFLKRD